jgi:hypothetical protein
MNRYVHHSTQSCKTLQLRQTRHHYCTAQTHENIKIERQASDIFSSIRRTGISCDSRQPYESSRTIHPSVTCISRKIYETRTDERHTAWLDQRVPFLGVDSAQIFTQLFLYFIKHTKPIKKILLSRYRTGTFHTQETCRPLL